MAFFKNLEEFWKSELSQNLISEVKNGDWTLFAGAGFSVGALNQNKEFPPLGDTLKKILGTFLGDTPDTAIKQSVPRLYERALRKDKEGLRKLLEAHYLGCTPTWQKIISSFAWRRIYTTNIDDVIQKTYSDDKQSFQKASFRDYAERIPIGISSSTLQVIHLHGRLSRKDSDLIFSPSEYARGIGDDWLALQNFSQDQLNGKILYIGSQLNEPDFDFYIQNRLGKEYDGPIQDSLLIDKNIDEAGADYFDGFKIHCIKTNGEDFFKELHERTKDRVPPVRVLGAVGDSKMTKEERESFQSFSDAFALLPDEMDHTFVRQGFDFFEGGPISLLDLESNLDCRFGHTEDALKICNEWAGATNTISKGVLLHGGSGCGKSASLRRIAYELTKRIKLALHQ